MGKFVGPSLLYNHTCEYFGLSPKAIDQNSSAAYVSEEASFLGMDPRDELLEKRIILKL